jgi:hypothetical protein
LDCSLVNDSCLGVNIDNFGYPAGARVLSCANNYIKFQPLGELGNTPYDFAIDEGCIGGQAGNMIHVGSAITGNACANINWGNYVTDGLVGNVYYYLSPNIDFPIGPGVGSTNIPGALADVSGYDFNGYVAGSAGPSDYGNVEGFGTMPCLLWAFGDDSVQFLGGQLPSPTYDEAGNPSVFLIWYSANGVLMPLAGVPTGYEQINLKWPVDPWIWSKTDICLGVTGSERHYSGNIQEFWAATYGSSTQYCKDLATANVNEVKDAPDCVTTPIRECCSDATLWRCFYEDCLPEIYTGNCDGLCTTLAGYWEPQYAAAGVGGSGLAVVVVGLVGDVCHVGGALHGAGMGILGHGKQSGERFLGSGGLEKR